MGWVVYKIITAAMNKGQLLPLGVLLLLFVIVLRLPSENLVELSSELVGLLKKGSGVGYFLSVIILVAWRISLKKQRKTMSKETNRVSEERTYWQEKACDKNIESSEGKK